ncbi:uncharacterized protein N7459_003174 [Penicillium hispanicum]|uniref:uncharacterized protein n=1 Tax=Penicillium hispanicum TaxID=1080232 RepID=UPI00254161B2|nr:uncharacterized protein N7459_003174 [Penicillium hispanicum]KAJ5587409.1 hypothetical protein N7459_003174 [Penicillium hispanicum]
MISTCPSIQIIKNYAQKMSGSRKAIIIGAGPAGLAAALRLHQQTDVTCTLYELRPEPTTLGGAVGILPNGLRLMHRLGVYDAATTRGASGRNLTLHSLQGHIVSSQDYVGWAREQTGFGYMRIKRSDLVDVLLDAVNKAAIPIRFGKHLTRITEDVDEVRVEFADGSTDAADMLLGCDGIHSFVRRSYVDPALVSEYSGIAGLASIIPSKDLSSETTRQILGLEATHTEDGVLAVNPCTANRDEMYFFLSREVALPDSGDSRDGWEAHGKEEVDGFKAMVGGMLESARGEWGDALRDLVANTSVLKFYPVYRLPPGGTWSKGRCVLVGDAAHAMSPHAGQGVSMALEDVFLLSRLLEDRDRPLREVFEKYDQIRRPRVNEIFAMAAQNGKARRKTTPWGLWFREFGMSMAMNLMWAVGLDKRGFSQTHLVYDIDRVEL